MNGRAPLWLYGVALAALFCFGGYVWMQSDDPAPALRALEAEGYTDARVTAGHSVASWLHGCGDDALAYEAEATSPKGKRVKVVVCCGALMKACTVRIP